MNRDKRHVPVSPYLLRPLRSMVQAMRDLRRLRQTEGAAVPEPKVLHDKVPSEAD